MWLPLLLLACGPTAPPAASSAPPAPERPRLLVYVVIDQLPTSLYDRMKPHFEGGLARLEEEAWSGTTRYAHAVTLTCPGHATLSTGASPRVHGIVGNAWVEAGERRYCGDIEALRADTLADRVAAAGGRVASLSFKDRSAIMLGGRTPDAIAWYDKEQGRWCDRAPEWLSSDGLRPLLTESWKPARPELYATLAEDDRPVEEDEPVLGRTFPHPAPGPENPELLASLPSAGGALTDAALQAVDRLELGSDADPDLLAISYSHNDYIGHTWTSESWEAMDALLALDRDLGRLFSALDERVGEDRWVLALTSDHGVAPSTAVGLDPAPVGRAAAEALEASGLTGELSGGETSLTLPTGGDEATRAAAAHAIAAAIDAIDGVSALAWQVDGVPDDHPHAEALRNSLVDGRSGDVFLLPDEAHLFARNGVRSGSNHGTPYRYDTDVPLLLRGPVPDGLSGPVDARSIAPTLAFWAGLPSPEQAEREPLK